MNFVALDFETATHERNSACELGICVVENSEIVETKTWLIKPPSFPYFNPHNINVHGIYPKDVAHAPTFDERFFAHQEEIDLCWRLKNAGRKIYYCGKSTVFHVGGGTLNKQSPQKTFLNFRNNLTMLLKNLPTSSLFWIIPLRLVLDGIAGIYFGMKDGFPHLIAVLKAHFGFYGMFAESLKLRSKNQIKDYYQSKWLIFKHFL